MMVTLSRLYDRYEDALVVVDELEARGLPEDDIGIISRHGRTMAMRNAEMANAGDRTDRDRDGVDDRVQAAETGAGIGGAVGAAAGLLAGLGVFAIPGIGPVIGAGWLAATLAGTAAGGAAGGIIGALTKAGVSANDADFYAEGIRRGGTLVTVRVYDQDVAAYEAILERAAVNAAERGGSYRKAGWKGFDPAGMPVELRNLEPKSQGKI